MGGLFYSIFIEKMNYCELPWKNKATVKFLKDNIAYSYLNTYLNCLHTTYILSKLTKKLLNLQMTINKR